MELEVWFDGAVEPTNPGGTGVWGFLIRGPGFESLAQCGTLGARPDMTNNVAEYAALGKALRFLADAPPVAIGPGDLLVIRGDSRLVIEQVNGTWACRNDRLRKLLARVHELLTQLGCKWCVEWVPRERNEEADALTRRAYEEATGRPFPERHRKPRRSQP